MRDPLIEYLSIGVTVAAVMAALLFLAPTHTTERPPVYTCNPGSVYTVAECKTTHPEGG